VRHDDAGRRVAGGGDHDKPGADSLQQPAQPVEHEAVGSARNLPAWRRSTRGEPRWPVTISYFDKSKKTENNEQTPAYAIGFELYENGISRALVLDYNDFVVSGKLSSLELKEPKPCP